VAERHEASIGRMSFAGAAGALACALVAGYRAASEGSVGSARWRAVMVFGLTFWFGVTGSTLLADLPELSGTALAAALGLLAVIVGLGYKASIVPFHFWAADAYDGAPVSVVAFLSIVPKVGAILALARLTLELPDGLMGPLGWLASGGGSARRAHHGPTATSPRSCRTTW
jgi:NADH:ubiquinone oxidoreductase subunit 4 (subunit M)